MVGLIFLIASGVMVRLHLILIKVPGTDQQDVYYSWVEGQRILSGVNPYARVLTGNMTENQKYATYFPAFYLLSSATQLLGLRDFPDWVGFWRVIFLAFDIGIAVLIFLILDRYRLTLIGIFAALFWLFNRWTLDVLRIADIEFIPIFFLVWSMLLLRKHQRASLILLSISLAVKQIAIFLVPLYLLWIWQTSDRERIKHVVIAAITIFSVPLITSLPFLLWNAEGFIKSVAFSVTRDPSGHFDSLSVGEWFNLIGIKARVPLIGLLLLVYVSMFQKRIGIYVGSLLVMAVFLDFNPVLFRQYMCWVLPFIPLAICDITRGDPINLNNFSEKSVALGNQSIGGGPA